MFNVSAASTASTAAATSVVNTAQPSLFAVSSVVLHKDRIYFSSIFWVHVQLSSSSSLRSRICPVKAMSHSQTLSAPTHDSRSSASGKKQALISLSDKKDLALLGIGLQEVGYTIVSTGGTATSLEKAVVSMTKVEQLTLFLEMLKYLWNTVLHLYA
ncbi:uncharacterized protein LOC123219056 isoform X2 [Mangifera indica]|uniref:uncharacterized protein LOC123219056 isoform X2 n=1 Tax=Mangifera indica TaxID=29780 RepID=UPI001CF960AD|nr:uncharacterized protein LOC123219056 isoform X2 [Mangifera indica]